MGVLGWEKAPLSLFREGADVFISARGEERLIRACEEISFKINKVTLLLRITARTKEGIDSTVCPSLISWLEHFSASIQEITGCRNEVKVPTSRLRC